MICPYPNCGTKIEIGHLEKIRDEFLGSITGDPLVLEKDFIGANFLCPGCQNPLWFDERYDVSIPFILLSGVKGG